MRSPRYCGAWGSMDELPPSWRRCVLGDVVNLKRGYDLPKNERRPGRVPVYSSSGATGSHDVAKVAAPGVVTGRYGTIGEVFLVDEPFWPLNTALYVEDFCGNDPRYCAELLRTLNYAAYDGKSGVPGINRNDLHTAEIVVPPLDEQVRISTVAAAIDDKTGSTRRVAALAEEFAATLFRSWFVDFDPVRAKAAGAKPVGVPEEALDLFPDRLVDSEIGPIPEGWDLMPFSEALEVNPRVPLAKGDEQPFIEMAAVDTWGTRPTRLATKVFSGSGCKFQPGDALMARITGCIEHGKGAFVDFYDRPGFGSTEFIVLRARPPLSPACAFLASRLSSVRQVAMAAMTGSSGRQRVPKDVFDRILLAMPPDTERWRSVITEAIEPHFALSRGLWKESRTLAELRDTLLPELVSGRIRIPPDSSREGDQAT